MRPCTVRIEHPAASISLASYRVASRFGKMRILQVTGIPRLACNFLTSASIVLGSVSRKEPYLPRLAIVYGHPKFKSTASHLSSTNLQAVSIASGSCPQNYANNGLSSGAVLNTLFRKSTP